MDIQNSQVASIGEATSMKNSSTVCVSSFLSENVSAALKDKDYSECSKLAKEQILGLRSFDDIVFFTEDLNEFISSLACTLVTEIVEPIEKGHTLLIIPNDNIEQASSDFKKFGLELLNLANAGVQLQDPKQLAGGSAKQVAEFFRSDKGRATKIARVIALAATSHELEDLKDCLGEACKRGQRPQITLIEGRQNNTITELTRSFLRSTASFDTHYYIQIHSNGKQRTDALIEALEAESLYPAIVFCKNNSEISSVDNTLRSSSIRTRKLIGKAPAHKVREIISDLKSGEARVLLATDGPSEQVELELFKLIINFSIPTEPECYIHRTESPLGPISNRKILSIVAPGDQSNFDYIKRIVSVKFKETSGPDSETLLQRQLERIEADAIGKFAHCDERIKDLAKKLAERSRTKELIAQLLSLIESRNSANVDSGKSQSDSNRSDPHNKRERERGGFRVGRGLHADNDDNDGYNDNRDQDDQNDEEGNKQRRNRSRGDRTRERHDRTRQNGTDENDTDNENSTERRYQLIVKKFSRMYLNKGAKDGIKSEELRKIQLADETQPVIHNCSVRQNYSFIDVPIEYEEQLLEKLKKDPLPGVKELSLVKAITIASKEHRAIENNESVSSDNEDQTPTEEASS
jgi:superfamily II DNA/RNA helicase